MTDETTSTTDDGEAITESQMPQWVEEAAEELGVDAVILRFLLERESGMDPNAPTGADGEEGPAQIMELWERRGALVEIYQRFGEGIQGTEWRKNPEVSIWAAAEILARFKGEAAEFTADDLESWEFALAAYNWGNTRTWRHLRDGGSLDDLPAVVQQYVQEVMERSNRRPPRPTIVVVTEDMLGYGTTITVAEFARWIGLDREGLANLNDLSVDDLLEAGAGLRIANVWVDHSEEVEGAQGPGAGYEVPRTRGGTGSGWEVDIQGQQGRSILGHLR